MKNRGLVLIVDDESSNIEVLAAILEPEHEVAFADNGGRALDLARSLRPDVLLLDIMMPGMDGFEVCTRLKRDPDTEGIPVIFITALGDASAEAHGLELGAADYVAKPLSPAVVRVRVRNQVELKRSRDQLKRLTMTDGLTGIANRRCFDETIERELHRTSRWRRPLSLVLLDIDHFKGFNDTYGHVAGDECLQQVSAVIAKAATRASDLAARYGGEEFAVVLPETGNEGAVLLAERIRAAVAALAIPHAKSLASGRVTVSLGVVTADSVASPRELLMLADRQLYLAKAGGRNRIADVDLAGSNSRGA